MHKRREEKREKYRRGKNSIKEYNEKRRNKDDGLIIYQDIKFQREDEKEEKYTRRRKK